MAAEANSLATKHTIQLRDRLAIFTPDNGLVNALMMYQSTRTFPLIAKIRTRERNGLAVFRRQLIGCRSKHGTSGKKSRGY
jgi:hypothetical protein